MMKPGRNPVRRLSGKGSFCASVKVSVSLW